jgi:CDP-diacylglycerol--glycerol-3-phosphate 3-phosphatidyltransferase
MDIIGDIHNIMSLHKNSRKNSVNLSILRKKWLGLGVVQIMLVAAGSFLLVTGWEIQAAFQWSGFSLFASVLYFWYLWRGLELNSPPGDTKILPDFGPGNLLTILRGMLLMLLMGFLFSPSPQGWIAFLPGFLYAFAALADLFDGYLARISNHQSRLGEKLDLSLDGLGMLIASILLVQYNQVPFWYLLVGLARYLFIGGIWLRTRLGKPVHTLAENSARRPFAGAQMGFAAVVLFPVFSPPGTFLAAALFAVPFLTGFLLDYFSVAGISINLLIKQDHLLGKFPNVVNSIRIFTAKSAISRWLPLFVRTTLVILLILWLRENFIGSFGTLDNSLFNQYLPDLIPAYWIKFLLLLILAGLILITVGIAGRAAALLVLFGLGMYLEIFQLGLIEVLLVFAATGLFYLGTGPYSLWIPERMIITRRLGEL